MSNMITLAIPEAPLRSATQAAARQGANGAGIRLGVLDNSKPNADLLLKGLLERVAASSRLQSVLVLRKPNAALAAPAAILNELAANTDLVVSAIGD